LVPIAVFLATVAISLPIWRHANPGATVKPPASAATHQSGSRESHAPSKIASADQLWLSHLRTLLRAGDIAAVQEELNRAASDQPLLALAAIHQLACLEEMLDLNGPAAKAASLLPWGDPRSAEALNQLNFFDTSLWGPYLAAQTGKRPPEEIYAEAQKAGTHEEDFYGIYNDWAKAEAMSDPEGFVPLLAGAGASDSFLWYRFFSALEERPEFFPTLLDRIPRDTQNRDCVVSTLREWLLASPTAATLIETTRYASLNEIQGRGGGDNFLDGLINIDPAQRSEVLSVISQQPAYKRADLVGGMGKRAAQIDDLLPVLEQSPSISGQQKIVDGWLQAQESDNPSLREDPSWLDRLPSQKLRDAVKESLSP